MEPCLRLIKSIITFNEEVWVIPHGFGLPSLFSTSIQSTLVISNSIISNNRLSRRENQVLIQTQKSNIRYLNIVDKTRNCSSPVPIIFSIFISNERNLITYSFVKFGCAIRIFVNSENLKCRSMDISKCFRGVPSTSR